MPGQDREKKLGAVQVLRAQTGRFIGYARQPNATKYAASTKNHALKRGSLAVLKGKEDTTKNPEEAKVVDWRSEASRLKGQVAVSGDTGRSGRDNDESASEANDECSDDIVFNKAMVELMLLRGRERGGQR
jgi:hypothetical protein